MKRTILAACVLFCLTAAFAVPAKLKWKTVRQADGTTIEVALTGDERLHYFTTRDNVPLVRTADNKYCYATVKRNTITSTGILAHEEGQRSGKEINAMTSPNKLAALARQNKTKLFARKIQKTKSIFTGKKKAPVILAYFPDKMFAEKDSEIVKFYDDMLNKDGFSQFGAPGSVNNYFKDMSRGAFDLSFDVIGPVRVSKSSTYYGGPSIYFGGTDHIGEFITEAVKNADAAYDIDWSQYDWNGDGEVEQVFVLYAGYGQATGGPTGTIWPNAWTLDEARQNNDGNGGFSLKGVFINQYACSNELYGESTKTKMGLGVFCHEFSHCMGLPDFYDTSYGKTPTMGDWDLLASGSYNGPQGIGWCPAGWTSYERAFAGWLEPEELQPNDSIADMTGLEDADGKAYIIHNDANKNEYYLLENHKNKGWDAYTPESGLLVIHVDYDSTLFANNIVNTTGTFTPEEGYDGTFTNDHARMAPISRIKSINNKTFFYTFPMKGSRFTLDSLTNNSYPAATVFNANTDGSLFMNKPIRSITKDEATGNISFAFMPDDKGTSGINGIRNERRTPYIIHNIEGTFVGKAADYRDLHLAPGIYIIRQDGIQTKKIVIGR